MTKRSTGFMSEERQSEDEISYNWMDTYGDLVTLLLCFFVLLFAMSNIDKSKFERIANSFKMTGTEAAVPAAEGADAETDRRDVLEAEAAAASESMEKLFESLESYIDEQGLGNSISVSLDEAGIKMIFADRLFFDSGNADLKRDSMVILLDIIPFFENFQGIFRRIKVEGHTDSRPISNRLYKNNWWLSNVRALNVADYILENSSIDPAVISCEGRGEYQPVADNSTPEGRAKNRRVELVIAL